MEELQEATNFKYVDPLDEKEVKRIFITHANSYHAKEVVRRIAEINETENGKILFEILGTVHENQFKPPEVQILDSKSSDFLFMVSQCEIIVCDISQDKNQLEETKQIVKFLEDNLEAGNEFSITLILISSIMTWAKTPKTSDEIMTDRHYRKRRPHPCFNQHLILERKVLNLQKKYQKSSSIKSFVVCSGIIYGEEEDIFHYIFKNSYFNYPQVDIFLPGSNTLPLIYIHDFAKFIMHIINKSPDDGANYLLAVQPDPISVKKIVTSFVKALGGEEMRVRFCEKEEIFLMNEDMMTVSVISLNLHYLRNMFQQRVYDHLTLDLYIQSELLSDFQFEISGSNFEENVGKVVKEFYDARNLKPMKILIDGSPFAYQNDLAKMFCDYYHLHHVKHKCFMKNFITRLKKKIEGAIDYQRKMGDISSKHNELADCPMMMMKAQNDITAWNEKIETIQSLLGDSEEVLFEDKEPFIKERLSSFACLKNQGYVMSGFELDSIKASSLFLDETGEDFDELKPDVVILLNRTMEIDPECLEIEGYNETDKKKSKQWKLKYYYDSQYEDISLYNFFNDRNIMPIEISVDHDLTQLELMQMFEKLKSQIGEPCTYELLEADKLELEKLKERIFEKQELEKAADEKMLIDKEREENENQIEEWTQQAIKAKQKELEEIEQRSIPIRHYLMKYVIPKISSSLVELAKCRPENPAQFLAYVLSQQEQTSVDDENLDEEVIEEFKRLVNASKCDE